MSTPRTRAEWLDLLQRCQNGYATCLFVLRAIEEEQEALHARVMAAEDVAAVREGQFRARQDEIDSLRAKAERWESLCTDAWRRHDETSLSLFHANQELVASRAADVFGRSPPLSSSPKDSHGMWPISAPSS